MQCIGVFAAIGYPGYNGMETSLCADKRCYKDGQEITVAMQRCTELRVDGDLLWQYTCGSVDIRSHTRHSRGAFDDLAHASA
jgi:hypothetical protein